MHRRQVVGPDARAQAVGAVVGHAQGVGLIVERNGHQHRAEDLFLHQRMLLVHIHYHRRLDEIPRAELFAAAGDGGAAFAAHLDVAIDPLLLARGNQRAHLDAGVQAIAQLHGIGDAGDVGHHLVEMLALHIQPGAGAAHLALVEEDRAGSPGRGAGQIGVGHDDGW